MTRASLSAVFEQEVLGNLRQIAPKIEQKHPQEHHLFCQKIPRYAPLKVEKTKERKRKKTRNPDGDPQKHQAQGGGSHRERWESNAPPNARFKRGGPGNKTPQKTTQTAQGGQEAFLNLQRCPWQFPKDPGPPRKGWR